MSTLAFGKAVRDEPIQSLDQLASLFRRAGKPVSRHKVGLELEEILVRPDGSPVPYDAAEGPSIRGVLERLGASARMRPVRENGKLIGLEGAIGTVSLEPGGQVEMSTVPVASLHDLAALVQTHTRRLRRIGAEAGARFVEQGLRPFASIEKAEWMPKTRYRIMRDYLPRRGRLALRMMNQTASVQCSFDYSDDADWRRKFRAAHLLTPFVQAMFANSPFRDGKPSRYLSYRARIWEQTDPRRCGLLPAAFRDDVAVEDYVRYALDVPMMFLIRSGEWIPMRGASFRRFMEKGHEGTFPTLEDWGLHLSGIFTHVRLKSYIEVRAHDLVPSPLAMAVPALWKGILYDREALDASVKLLGPVSHAQAIALLAQAARRGLRAVHRGRPVLDYARELARLAAEGLRRQGVRRRDGRDESIHLEPLEELLGRGITPAEELLERYRRDWKRDLLHSLV